jgi:hypothetical protein
MEIDNSSVQSIRVVAQVQNDEQIKRFKRPLQENDGGVGHKLIKYNNQNLIEQGSLEIDEGSSNNIKKVSISPDMITNMNSRKNSRDFKKAIKRRLNNVSESYNRMNSDSSQESYSDKEIYLSSLNVDLDDSMIKNSTEVKEEDLDLTKNNFEKLEISSRLNVTQDSNANRNRSSRLF